MAVLRRRRDVVDVWPGSFEFLTNSDDGSYLVLAPAAFAYTQPANFQGATGLTAGTAVVSSGGFHGTGAGVSGSATIAAGIGAANLYWLTYEYFEGAGGAASTTYQWTAPGGTRGPPPEGVVWGQVRNNGTPLAGATVAVVTPNGTTHTLVTDANGYYGYDATPTTDALGGWTTAQNVAITATGTAPAPPQSATVGLAMGAAVRQDFDLSSSAQVQLFKRITQVVSYGPTPGPTTAPLTIVPTPDPGSLANVAGTATFGRGFYPGDVVTYAVFFRNIGFFAATGSGTFGSGPLFTDVVQAPQSVVAGSQTFSCCASPAGTTIGASNPNAGTTLAWQMNAPLPVPVPAFANAPVQGQFGYRVLIP